MKLILADVISVDGKLTKWDGHSVREWASVEDGIHLKETIHASDAMILGSGTYDAVRPNPSENILRVVLTSEPARYAAYQVPGQLEFTKQSPRQIVTHLKDTGHRQVLLLGGSKTATAFLRDGLVDELWMTIEPYIFGAGLPVTQDEKLDVELRLISSRQLNAAGTLLLMYNVLKK